MKTADPTPLVSEVLAPSPAVRCEPLLLLDDIIAARERLRGVVCTTPCRATNGLGSWSKGQLFLKHEHLQPTRSFKERGAANALLQLSPAERAEGVVAASAGNHGLGLAWHGSRLGVPVKLVIPANAPRAKIERCCGLGAHVELWGNTFEAADARAREIARMEDRRYVHPFDDVAVMAGQGTVALEILEQVPHLTAVLVPVGGGGLLAGVATAIRTLRSDVRIIAVEPASAPGFWAAQKSGRCVKVDVQPTLADGLAVAQIGAKPFAATRGLVDRVVTVSEPEIAAAMVRLFESEQIVSEGAGAVALAALLSGRLHDCDDGNVVALIGGGNIDAATFARARQMVACVA